MTYLAISVGAVIGANLRFLVGRWIAERLGTGFPFGTLAVNVTGSLVIGLVMVLLTERAAAPAWVRPMVAIGLLGSYTTFSTYSYETLALVQHGSYLAAMLNVLANVGACLAGAYLGTLLGRAI